ncbi:5-methyltetrahydropteroyltriglutamate--homocysteine methyltransferase [Pyrofollis japonicus]|uniref:hypothetical protein n=1 Tax=Pyrofollis japonicus TaxID=3060460 RepID=UPI00295A62AE|nr:hypothetical protein [Pyrofollis japonicus]BEP18359.1 5-methyltetrahydropteroyltriglutamate--homocysteine methyltransferase [Pyrofollis japonicus]
MVEAFVLGGFPRSDNARHAMRDLDNGAVGFLEAYRTVFFEELLVVGAQVGLGYRLVADPVLSWHDMFRPFAEAWRNVAVDGLQRFFDNNFFYRVPVFRDKPDPARWVLPSRAKLLAPRLPKGHGLRVLVPGPVTFAKLSKNEAGIGAEGLAEEIARILAEEARKALEAGAAGFEVAEPWLGDPDATKEDAKLVAELFNKYFAPLAGTKILSVYYHPPSPEAMQELAEAKADYVAISYADAPSKALKALAKACPQGLALGVINARSIYPDPLEKTRQAIQEVEKTCKPEKLVLTTTAPLDLIPFTEALEKLKILAKHSDTLQ